MDSRDENVKAGEKRSREVVSSVSEADNSTLEPTKVKQKKKKPKGKDCLENDSDANDTSEPETINLETSKNKQKKQRSQTTAKKENNEIDIAAELKEINMKLNNVLTKDSGIALTSLCYVNTQE
jgi:hypothetical protein